MSGWNRHKLPTGDAPPGAGWGIALAVLASIALGVILSWMQ